ncbi:MAG TPA: ABC transporter permease [Rhizobacter sp.]
MKSLDHKLLRDLRTMWSQALTIALVVASGIAGIITCLSAVDSLAAARDRFYAEGVFADVFATVKRAPNELSGRLRDLPGVADVQTTVEQVVRIEIPQLADPILGQLIGIDTRTERRMNRVTPSSGRWPASGLATRADGSIEALVSEAFFNAHQLRPGARLQALVNGKRRTLVVVGTALSPEYVFAGLWGMPDTRGFGVFWVHHDTLAAAYDMEGAFNRVAVKLAPGASAEAVRDGVNRLTAAYGGQPAYMREQQTSHAMLSNEIKEQRVLGTVLPAIFLGVAAFLLNVVVSRLVSTQREQVAALKALGYDNRAVAVHYLKLVLAIVSAGLVIGVAAGKRLGVAFTGLYAEFFHFPSFEHTVAPWLIVSCAVVALLTAVVGTLNAILSVVRLPPAEAMRPPAPGQYRRTLAERLGLTRLPTVTRMVMRNLERRPWRSALSVGGVAAAVAIVVLGNFVRDAIGAVIDQQFVLSLRGDVSTWTVEPVDEPRVRQELLRVPGVRQVEATRFADVNITLGHRSERVLLRGYDGRASLYRLIDADGLELLLDGRGLVLTDRLAEKLGLAPGDRVTLEVLDGRRKKIEMRVSGTVRETMGMNAFLDRKTMNRMLGDGDLANGFVLSIDPGHEAAVLDATKALPRASGAWSKATMLRNMEEISARNVRIMSTVLTVFASIIAVGVVYNNARIALAERAWELASLRVLGFTQGEVSAVLLGELATVIALAIPVGMGLGWALTHGVVELLKSDQFHFPVVLRAPTYAWAGLCVAAAGIASAMVVRRRIDRLDMVMALKTRE